jgi:hypothetical protein
MIVPKALIAWCALAMLPLASLSGEERIVSGLQPGEELTGLFEPLNVTGPHAGEPHCLVCENGANPVVMVFARDLSEPLVKLMAKIDAATGQHHDHAMGSFVVFLSEDERLQGRLEETARKHKLAHLVLAIDAPAGPDGFKVSAIADVTVVLYENHQVKANHAFARGELSDKGIDAVLADVPKILPAEKTK